MLRILSLTTLCLGLLSACTTTQHLTDKFSSTSTPLAQVFKERPDLKNDLATVEIRQYFNRVENPTAAEVKVTETGLMDDSVKSIRTIYQYKLINGQWQKMTTQKEYQCYRGKNTKTFQTIRCP